jgi:hypothetical protein
MLVQVGENFATLTPFGSLIRMSSAKVNTGRSWPARLRAVLGLLFRSIRYADQRPQARRFRRSTRKYLRRY